MPLPVSDVLSIMGLGGIEVVSSTVEEILSEHGFTKQLFRPQEIAEIRRRERLLAMGLEHHFDQTQSVAFHFRSLFDQAEQLQHDLDRPALLEVMLQHLVGAKLDIVLGLGAVAHHGSSVADHSTERSADFQVNEVAIHVTTHPTEALIRKAAANLQAGLKPVIVTLSDGVEGAAYLLKGTEWRDRIDVIDATQFLTANVYERSLFKAGDCKTTLSAILARYNEIVESCETDPVLRIRC